jgi:hypothetical protein
MKLNVRRTVSTLALAFAIGLGGGVTQAAAEPFFQQDQAPAPDYSHNKTYQQGQREGHADQAKNLDHSKKRHFKKEDDQKAYEAGYQQGRNNH